MPTPAHADIYVVATSVMAALFAICLVRVWMLNRHEEKLEGQKDELERQLRLRQQELATVRQDALEWRAEIQRQFDGFRKMANDQLSTGETRYTTLQAQARQREYELLTALDLARQMCTDLPHTQARVLHLESLLAQTAAATTAATGSAPGAHTSPFTVAAPPSPDAQAGAPAATQEPRPASQAESVTPLPDLGIAQSSAAWNGRLSGTPAFL